MLVPAGCYAGYLLVKVGHKVSIYENHAQIGLPIQCTGLLTSDFDRFNLPMDSFLVNTFFQSRDLFAETKIGNEAERISGVQEKI